MKKLITIIFTLLLVLGLSAQTDQGDMLLGANTNFTLVSSSVISGSIDGEAIDDDLISDAVTTTSLAEAQFGYFLINNLVVGPYLTYTGTKVEVEGVDDLEGSAMTYGAFMRYYIGGVAFVGGSYGMQTQSAWDDWDDKPTVMLLSGEAGFSLFLSDNVAFTPRASYQITSTKQEVFDVDVVENKGALVLTAGLTIHL